MLFYVYVIHFDDFSYYVGKRKCPTNYNPWNDPYFGSPKTNKYKWETNKFTKVVIECFSTDKEACLAETKLLLDLDWDNDPYCLNECCGGKFSYEANRRGALTRNKLPTKQSTRDKISELNKQRWSDPNWDKKEKIIRILQENQAKAVEAAKTPEVIEKRTKTNKERGHQQGEKNSQYGTMLIYNIELRETRRINKEDPIPDGWEKGAIYDFDGYFRRQEEKENKKKQIQRKREEEKNQKIKFYTEWYEIYRQTNFSEFCEITGYSKSQQNLCAKFKKFVVNYEPKAKNTKF